MPAALKAIYDFPYGDKVGHFLLMGCLALLLNLALGKRSIWIGRRRIWLGSALTALGVSMDELAQFAFPLRTPDFWDWAASMMGIILADAILRYRWRSM